MADPVLGYTPVDGDPLDVAGVNADLYSLTPSVSLYETANGNIELGNFASSFRVRTYHIQQGEVGGGDFIGKTFSSDYFQDAWGTGEVYKPVAGACFTFYQRRAVSVANLFASMFVSAWRSPGPLIDPTKAPVAADVNWEDPPAILVRMFEGQNGLEATRRRLPQSVFFDMFGHAHPYVTVRVKEQQAGRHFNLFHPKIVGGTAPNDQLVQGWASFGFAVYIAHNKQGHDTDNANDSIDPDVGGGGTDARPQANYNACHRVRVYVSNAGCVTLL